VKRTAGKCLLLSRVYDSAESVAEGWRIKDLFTLPYMILLTNRRQSR